MPKRSILTLILLVLISGNSWSQSPFSFFIDNNEPVNDAVVELAEKMYQKFSSVPADTVAKESIKNPFLSQLPHKEPEEPLITVVTTSGGPVILSTGEVIEPPPKIEISGLIWNSDLPQAILNNNIVGIGDDVGGWKVIDISQEGVLMESSSQTRYWIKP